MRIILFFTLLFTAKYISAQDYKYQNAELLSQWVTQSITSPETNTTENVNVVHSLVHIGDENQDGIEYIKYIQEFYDSLGELQYYNFDLVYHDLRTIGDIDIHTFRTKDRNIECSFRNTTNAFETMEIKPINGRYKNIVKLASHGLIYNSLLRGDLADIKHIHEKFDTEGR